ncbi:DNA translocase FtsK [Streptomyces sp. NPDC051016]|uniref:type IV secretory system conjugative DNA transfer family protein n=1 Tax=Streptomyces sp. NPDC051016 TaxID=3365638 RepID=UPI003787ABE8
MRRMPTRAKAELAAYGASSAALAVLPNLEMPTAHLTAAAIGGASLWRIYRQTKTGDFRRTVRSAQRLLGPVTGSAVYAAAAMTPGTRWWEIPLAVGWGGLMAAWLPATRSTWAPGDLTAAYPAGFEGLVMRLWDQHQVAPHTRLENIRQTISSAHPDFECEIVAPQGTPVGRIEAEDIAAAFGVPTLAVAMRETAYGPGRILLTVSPTQETGRSIESLWEKLVARPGGAIPESRIVRIEQQPAQSGIPARGMILAVVDPGKVARVNHEQLCTAFGMQPEEMRLVTEVHGNEVLVTVYESAPLTSGRKATRELLTLDSFGRYTIGTTPDGRDAKVHMRSASGTLHGFLVGVTGSGKTVALALMCAAWALAGLATWVTSARPDAQMSVVGRHVDRQGAGAVFTWWLLKTAIALMDIRGAINAEVGHDFSAHSPYPGLTLVLDEFNSLVGDEKLGDDIASMTDVAAREGRKFGIGVIFAGQSLNLDKLGGAASLRDQVQGGIGVVLRITGGIAARQATGGLAGDVDLAPIPDRLGAHTSLLDRMLGTDTDVPGESTQGMGHTVTGTATMMRTLRVHLPDDGSSDGLGDLFPESGINQLTDREIEALTELGLWHDWTMEPPTGKKKTGEDDFDGAAEIGMFAPPPVAQPARGKGPTVKEKILAAVDREMTAKEIRGTVDAAAGTIRNALSDLVTEGRLRQVDHGFYAPATTAAGTETGDESPLDAADTLITAAELVITSQFGSTSMLQRKLRTDLATATRLMAALEHRGIVGPADGGNKREVLVTADACDDVLREIRADLTASVD